jgi:hypothetical protein
MVATAEEPKCRFAIERIIAKNARSLKIWQVAKSELSGAEGRGWINRGLLERPYTRHPDIDGALFRLSLIPDLTTKEVRREELRNLLSGRTSSPIEQEKAELQLSEIEIEVLGWRITELIMLENLFEKAVSKTDARDYPTTKKEYEKSRRQILVKIEESLKERNYWLARRESLFEARKSRGQRLLERVTGSSPEVYSVAASFGFNVSKLEGRVKRIENEIERFLNSATIDEIYSALEKSPLYGPLSPRQFFFEEKLGRLPSLSPEETIIELGLNPDRTVFVIRSFDHFGRGEAILFKDHSRARSNAHYGLPEEIPVDGFVPLPSGKGFIRRDGAHGASAKSIETFTIWRNDTFEASRSVDREELIEAYKASMGFGLSMDPDSSILQLIRDRLGVPIGDRRFGQVSADFNQYLANRGLLFLPSHVQGLTFFEGGDAKTLRVMGNSKMEDPRQFILRQTSRKDLEIVSMRTFQNGWESPNLFIAELTAP